MADYHITDATELQDMNIHLADDCYLDNNIDASATIGWNVGEGFIPVGTLANPFIGNFFGGNYKITDLFINRPDTDYVGLFGYASTPGGIIRNVGLENCNITGQNRVGCLGGLIETIWIRNCYATGELSGHRYLGGLIGETDSCMISEESYASVNISVLGDIDDDITFLGGLVGFLDITFVSDCHATGNIITGNAIGGGAPGHDIGQIGGLIGHEEAPCRIENCYATGNISVGNATAFIHLIGALIGRAVDDISHSYATGSIITGNALGNIVYIGGLIGWALGIAVSECYASGNITIGNANEILDIGGLVGYTDGISSIEKSKAYGNIKTGDASAIAEDTGIGVIGGLVGFLFDGSTLSDCYAQGNIETGDSSVDIFYIGGLIGWIGAAATVSNSHSKGSITTGSPGNAIHGIGGLVGENDGNVSNSFWDTQTSGLAFSDGGTGKSTEEMKTKETFTDAGWDFNTIWNLCEAPYFPSYPWLQWQDIECKPRAPTDLWCEQKTNPRDVRDPNPEFSAIHHEPS